MRPIIAAHHAHLFIGNMQQLADKTEHMLQTMLCPDGGCTYCLTCRRIRERQHPQILWIVPEKQYTLECIAPVFAALALQRSEQEPYYIVLHHADFLTTSCANMLLKSIEEPPAGYFFILLASRKHMVLPTIRSRCVIHDIHTGASTSRHEKLFDHFTHKNFLSPLVFIRFLDEVDISERDSVELIDALIGHWRTKVQVAIKQSDISTYTHAVNTINLLIHAAQQPPMPGSSKLFWKNLFLQIK